MDRGEVFAQVTHLEKQLGQFYRELGSLKQQVIELLEANHQLQVENQNLRSRVNALETEQSGGEAKIGGHENLQRIYHEGFHVCNMHYGSLRTNGDCLFCLSLLNRNESKK